MTSGTNSRIYLDYQATTPVDAKVLEAMQPYWAEKFGNPHSRLHGFGWEAEAAVEGARQQVAASIKAAKSEEIVFTSGATESNNLAIKGVAEYFKSEKNHIITLASEHSCVLAACAYLEKQGFKVTYVPVQKNGLVALEDIESALTDQTVLVSVMAVNNETGVILPIEKIGALCRSRGVYFHTDAAQALGRISLDVEKMNIDLLSLSGHKIYGPKGIGALYVRRKPRVRLTPQISGGGQEGGMRSGTLPTPLCVGLGEASALAESMREQEETRLLALRQQMWEALSQNLDSIHLNGDINQRIAGNLNIRIENVPNEMLFSKLKSVAISSGSACSSESGSPSHVLKALGLTDDQIRASVRICLGRLTTSAEIEKAAEKIILAAKDIRK